MMAKTKSVFKQMRDSIKGVRDGAIGPPKKSKKKAAKKKTSKKKRL
jgi:hypothetical protein